MKTFKERLDTVHGHIANHEYQSAIRESGIVLEIGFKDLFELVRQNFETSNHWINAFKEYEKKYDRAFDFNYLTLGSMIFIFQFADLWQLLRVQLKSNLNYVDNIPFGKLLTCRNKAVHENIRFSRYDALDFEHYLKVFLYDTELMEGKRKFLYSDYDKYDEGQCHECSNDISPKWKFCPNCGSRTIQPCSGCNRKLKAAWKICPFCNTSRSVVDSDHMTLYRYYCEAIWADYIVTPMEREFLNGKRLEFGISPDLATSIELKVIQENYHYFNDLLEMSATDNQIDDNERELLLKKGRDKGLTDNTMYEMIEQFETNLNELNNK